MTCFVCGQDVANVTVELDEKCRIVCRVCYLADPPAGDVDGALIGIEMAS